MCRDRKREKVFPVVRKRLQFGVFPGVVGIEQR
jgi:hypothetical protein